MEQKLRRLFDYQKFQENPKLAELIADTVDRYATELTDDDLSLVNAAGDLTPHDDEKSHTLENAHE